MKKTTIIAFLLVACMATMCFVGGTFAKYTSTVQGQDSVRVALWDVAAYGLAEGTDDFATAETTVNLFNTYTDANVDVNGLADNAKVIAPGTTGTFSYTLKNSSEVTAQYAIDYTVDEKNVPLMWSLNGTDWTDNLDDVGASEETKLAFGNGSKTITVHWRWAFGDDPAETAAGQSDNKDTELGEAGTAAPSVKIVVTFTQVD